MANAAPKKSLGQHFLTDRNILGAIVDAAGVGPGDTVVEVGPGRGALTAVLAERVGASGRIVAVELDSALAATLRTTMPAHVEIVEADAREADAAALLGGCTPYRLLGNLPYYAAMPILRAFLENPCPPISAAVLVQREVAEHMCARPGRMSLVSLAVQAFGEPRIARLVRPGAFHPPPKVTSAVVAIDVHREAAIGDVPAFFRMARAGFSAPRKQLRNAIANGLGVPPAEAEALLARAGIDPSRRAQTLSIAEWASLAGAAARQ
jgi:16S rRNA (adenine1518-N6/adenine1519-N6)-dimethyltransferase